MTQLIKFQKEVNFWTVEDLEGTYLAEVGIRSFDDAISLGTANKGGLILYQIDLEKFIEGLIVEYRQLTSEHQQAEFFTRILNETSS